MSITKKYGSIDRRHHYSFGPKLIFALLQGTMVMICIWLAFGAFKWTNPICAKILAFAVVLYFLRHLVTLFVLSQSTFELSEPVELTAFMTIFEIGFLLLGAGFLICKATPFGSLDGLGVALLLIGSYLNTCSELRRGA